MLNVSTIRPGILVSLSTEVSGNVRYYKQTIEAEHVNDVGQLESAWRTDRTIVDPDEFNRAKVARSRVRTLITAVCAKSDHGLLCPQSKRDQLEAALKEARGVADQFNATAKVTRVSCYVIMGEVAQDDVEAVRAINAEISGLLNEMQVGLQSLDVEVVRDAANKAKSLGAMLSDSANATVQNAIDAARKAARQIVKAGETGAAEIDTATIRKIAEARVSFLDLEGSDNVAVPEAQSVAIDFSPAIEATENVAAKVAIDL